jgi:glycerophosphoryl diester phosphodiesterase
MALGADAVELDVHCTRDGTVLVHHDPLLRTSPTAAASEGRPIAALTNSEVAAFRLADGAPPPTLLQVCKLLSGRATIYCELKGAGTAAAALDVLRFYPGHSAVHAFDHRQIAHAGVVAPNTPRGVLEVSRHVDPAASLRSVAARDLWQLAEFVDASLVHEVHAAGGRVIAWTVNDAAQMAQLAAWGVDGICTDDVALARQVLGR